MMILTHASIPCLTILHLWFPPSASAKGRPLLSDQPRYTLVQAFGALLIAASVALAMFSSMVIDSESATRTFVSIINGDSTLID
jgi:hypothetical protein